MTTWILANAALKGTVVLCAASVLAVVLRRRSAAARHLVWTAAAAALLALPFLSIGLPALRLPSPGADVASATGLVFRAFATIAPDRAEAALPSAPPTRTAKSAAGLPAAGDLLAPVWTLGAAVVLLQMIAAYGALWRKRRLARRFDDNGLVAALAGELGLRHPVDVLEARAGSMPMTFGLLRPAIFLPAEANQWTEERRRMVLLHELAHVRRGDMATHLLARAALSLHWWNPLAWIAWREFLKERERAADDLVLSVGERASDYAGHLLEVARSLQSGPATAWAAVAMARRSQLEGRLLAILDSGMRRGASTRLAPLAAALLAIAIVAPFAALEAQSRPAPPELDATIRAANAQKNHEILDRAARVYEELHKYETAQTLLETALTIRGEVSGQQSAAYAIGLVKLGDLAAKRRQYGEADWFYAKAVSLGDRAEVAPALLYLGIKAYREPGREAAFDFFQRALNVDPRGPQAGPALTWMALTREGQPDAEMLFQRALAVEEPNSGEAATTSELYAAFLRQHARDAEAEQAAARAREIRRAHGVGIAPRTVPESGAVRMSPGLTAPMLIHKVEPEYTPEARAARYQGTVVLSVEITPEGSAQNIRVTRGLGLGLDEKAIDAVQQWQFKPGRDKGGNAITVAATIEVNFRLM